MEALNQWKTAQLRLKEAASSFLDASITLRKVAAQSFPSHPNQIVLENVLDDLHSQIDSIGVVEHCMHESRAVLNALLNVSTSRVPINKLPPEILGRIFSILVASSPCYPKRGQRDALLDIIIVCGRWYQVATNHRSLWSHIDVHSAGPLALNRTRLWLDRCRGVPIHVHLSREYSLGQTALPNLISLLQPHAPSTSSLTISGRDTALARALLALHFGDNGPCPLKILAVSEVWLLGQERDIAWPTNPLRKLTTLELCTLQGPACPALDEVATILSDCPELHTLRFVHLRNFRIRPGQRQIPSVISLPRLKLLELDLVTGEGLAILLSMLHPGDLELDVRLKLHDIGEGVVPLRVQSLLTRSNVVSLTTLDNNSANGAQIQSFFSCMPRLRALHVRLTNSGPNILRELAGNNTMVPLLQSLWLSGGEVYPTAMDRVQQLVSTRHFRHLVFSSCKFQASYSPLPTNVENQDVDTGENGDANDDDNEDDDNDADEDAVFVPGEPNQVFKEIPERTKRWLSERVENLVICETPTTSIYDGVDPFVQALVKLG